MKNLLIVYGILIFLPALIPFSASAGADGNYVFLWGGFSTSLAGRSDAQMHNAGRAASDIDGTIIPPGGVFSFNDLVGSRDRDKGYELAPMINENGYLAEIPGGGICQLATTIYNAALYAGLEIVERHPHSRAVFYVPPGRDATIASWRKDLKLSNPHGVPVMIKIGMKDGRMTAAFWSTEKKSIQVEIRSDITSLKPETVVVDSAGLSDKRSQKGGKGFWVVTRRLIKKNGKLEERILSRDFYPPPTRIIAGESP